jgi:hypothetical protein
MRIGQLARHLNISPGELRYFIHNQGFATDPDTNTRLDEKQVKAVFDHFAPGKAETLETLIAGQEEQGQLPEPDEFQDQPAADHSGVPTETIRAPKIELQGLKVVGKIELPEPKKKQPEMETISSESAEPKPEAFRRRDPKPSRPWINPLEKKRLREAREAEEAKKKNLAREKELRTAAYLSRQIKLKGTTPVKNKTVKTDDMQEQRTKNSRPESLLGKIWHWLTNAE